MNFGFYAYAILNSEGNIDLGVDETHHHNLPFDRKSYDEFEFLFNFDSACAFSDIGSFLYLSGRI